jgi:hypothetical protein
VFHERSIDAECIAEALNIDMIEIDSEYPISIVNTGLETVSGIYLVMGGIIEPQTLRL